MYGIMVRNSGMWGCTTWCKKDGEIELYETKEEAERVADKYNNSSRINRFNDYWAEKYC